MTSTDKEIHELAVAAVKSHLDDGIEYCAIYELEEAEGFEPDELKEAHSIANQLLRALVLDL